MERPADEIVLHFTDGSNDIGRGVPAAALSRVLDGLQRVVHLIGMRLEGRTLARGARPSQGVQRRFVLICEPPAAGSYAQPLRLTTLDAHLLSGDELERASAELRRFLSAVGGRDERRLEDTVPDRIYRRLMLDAVAQALPDPRSGLALEITAEGERLLHSTAVQGFVESQLRPRVSTASAGVVNGELTEIDFAGRRITLRLLGARRDITCSYEDTLEATLLEHPRELIQVFGSVALDEAGQPKTIEAVEFIRPIQDEELTIDAFAIEGRSLRPRTPLKVMIRFDRDEQLFTAAIPELGVETTGETRDDVADGLTAELRLLWRQYALEDGTRLTAGARRLKDTLRAMFQETENAA